MYYCNYEPEGSVYSDGGVGYPDPDASGGPPDHHAHDPIQAPALSQSFYVPESQSQLGGYSPVQPQPFISQPQPVQPCAPYPPYVLAPDPFVSAPDPSALNPSTSVPPPPLTALTVSDFDPSDPALIERLCEFVHRDPLPIFLIYTNQAGNDIYIALGRALCGMDQPDRPPPSDATCIHLAKRVCRRIQRFCSRWYGSWEPARPPTVLRKDLAGHIHCIQQRARAEKTPSHMPWKEAIITKIGSIPPLWGYHSNPASKDENDEVPWTGDHPELKFGQSSGATGKGKEVMRQTGSHIVAPLANVAALASLSAEDFSQLPPRASTTPPASSTSVQGAPGFTPAQQNIMSFHQNIQNNTIIRGHSSSRRSPSRLSHSHSSYSLPDRRSIQGSVVARSLSHSHSLPSGSLAGASVPSLSSGLGNPIPCAEPANPTQSEPTEELPQELASTSRYLSVLVTESSKWVDSGTLPKEEHCDHLRISFRHLDAITRRLDTPTPSDLHLAGAPSIPHLASAPSAHRSSSSSSGIISTPPHSSSSSGHSTYHNQLIAPGASRLERGYEQAGAPLRDVDLLQGSNTHKAYGDGHADRFTSNTGSDAAYSRQTFQGLGPTQ